MLTRYKSKLKGGKKFKTNKQTPVILHLRKKSTLYLSVKFYHFWISFWKIYISGKNFAPGQFFGYLFRKKC